MWLLGGGNIYKAGGGSKPDARIGEAPDVLVISGGFVDTIDCVGLGSILPRRAGPFFPMLANLALDNVDAIFESLESYPTGELLSEVKWRTLIANKTAIAHKEPPARYGNLFRHWRAEMKGKTIAPTDADIYHMVPEEYFLALREVTNQKLCRTRVGYVGLVPTPAQAGDHIYVFSGAIVPFVLRDSAERPGIFRMVGGCYIHGIMKGEAFNFPGWKEKNWKFLRLH
jgi:hypothetical protein